MEPDGRPDGGGESDEFVARLTAHLDSRAERPLDDAIPAGMADAVAAELRSGGPWSAPPRGLRDTVMARVMAEAETPTDQEAEPHSQAAATAAAAVTPSVASLEARRARRDERAGRRPRLLWAVPAVAAAAAVFAVGVIATDRWVSDLRLDAETYQAAGTDLAPGATADIAITETGSGFAIRFDPQGLPAAAEGSYYAAWLRDADGLTVPIGTLHAREAGGSIELWSGVDPAGYEALTVTLQSVDAPVLPSGPAVLRAELSPPPSS